MVELFVDIPQTVKDQATALVDLAFEQPNFKDCVEIIRRYTETCYNEEEQAFVDFYYNLKMEQLNNESNSDLG